MAQLFATRRNRRFALVAVLYLGFLYGTLGLMPVLARWIFSLMGRSGFAYAIDFFIAAIALLVLFLARRRLVPLALPRLLGLAVIGVGYGLIVMWADSPPSRLHALQYGVLAFLVTESLRDSLPLPRVYAYALLFVMTAGLADEGIQMLLPNRSALLSEVLQNWASAGLAQGTMLVLKDYPPGMGEPLSQHR